jgi:arabinogalactan endo-1,4-beta-galactosidase
MRLQEPAARQALFLQRSASRADVCSIWQTRRSWILTRLKAVLVILLPVGATMGTDFVAGADLSHLAFFESRGVVYRDAGQVQDGLAILKRHGLTCVRLRLFTSNPAQAQADPYNYNNNLDYTLPLAVRVKNAGLQFILDFHYSDTWADPGHQAKPAAWTNLTFTQLAAQIRQYSSNCIAAFKAAGAVPDYVQVGNEITSGFLWPDGQVGGAYDTPSQWSRLGQLLTNAITGIREASGPVAPKIIIHIDRGGDWTGTQWFFDHLRQQQVPFDIIGESYYPFWHGSLDNLRNCLTNAAARYGKPLMLTETAFPYNNSTNLYGIPASTNGQVQYVVALARLLLSVPDGKVIGTFWWGAEYQPLPGVETGGCENRSFFGTGGEVLPVADAFGQLSAPLRLGIGLEAGGLTLQWPLSGAGSALMTTTQLSSLAGWQPVTNAVQNTGGTFRVTLPRSPAPSGFFRLQSN